MTESETFFNLMVKIMRETLEAGMIIVSLSVCSMCNKIIIIFIAIGSAENSQKKICSGSTISDPNIFFGSFQQTNVLF